MDSTLETLLETENYTNFGFAALKTPPTIEKYKNWIEQSFHGTMKFMAEHTSFKEFPQSLFENCQSAIVVTQDYGKTESKNFPLKNLRIAKYAKQEDYHHWFQEKLENTIKQLQKEFPGEVFVAAADSKPVLERDLAYRAGLGWVGKNTCLIDSRQGSLFFIGEILTSLPLTPAKATHPDRCGTCTKCIDHCPTGAILEPYVLDANKCISYLNIEKRGAISPSLSSKMNDWFFGCDICQNVCPWNEKIYQEDIKTEQVMIKEPTAELMRELKYILNTSGKKLLSELKAYPLIRTRASGLKRNALIVIANLKLTSLTPEVRLCLEQESLKATAQWTLGVLSQKN